MVSDNRGGGRYQRNRSSYSVRLANPKLDVGFSQRQKASLSARKKVLFLAKNDPELKVLSQFEMAFLSVFLFRL